MANFLFFSQQLNLQGRKNKLNARLMTLTKEQQMIDQQIATKQRQVNLNTTMSNISIDQQMAAQLAQLDPLSPTYEADKLSIMINSDTQKQSVQLSASLSDTQIESLEALSTQLDNEVQSVKTELDQVAKELDEMGDAVTKSTENVVPKYKS